MPKNAQPPQIETKLDAGLNMAIDALPLPYIEMDAVGIITRANRATLALHPLEHGELIGKLAWDLMATDEKEQSCAAYLGFMESGDQPPPVCRSLYTRSGEFRTYELHRNLILDANGRPAGMRMLCVDVTETKRALDEERRARTWLESMMGSAGAGMIVTDTLGLIRVVNPAAEMFLGWKASELIGQAIETALPLAGPASDGAGSLDFATGLEGHCKGIATVLDRQGVAIRLEIMSSPIVDKESGFTNGVLRVLEPVL